MLEPFSSVIVYDTGQEGEQQEEPAYCVMAHNLIEFDARRLADRLVKQYSLHAHVVKHRLHHTEQHAKDCTLCQVLFEEIVEKTSREIKEGSIKVITP